MKKSFFTLIILIIIICLFPLSGFAKTGYVSDMLLLTFRQGPGNSYAVAKTLKSNTPVTILEEKDGFYKVELASKEIGWVDKNFIIFTLPKTVIIDQLEKTKEKLENKNIKLQSDTKVLKDKLVSIKQDYSQTIKKLETSLKKSLDEKRKTDDTLLDSQKKYNILTDQSKNIQSIVKENKKFKKQNQALSSELTILKVKNKNLFKTGMIKWFLTGAGVLLIGWIIGQSVASKQKQSSSLLG